MAKFYSIRLPNGQMLRGIPSRIDPKKVIADAEAVDANPTSDNDWENFRAGMGRAVVNMGRNVANLALPEEWEPDWAKDEAILEANKRDRPLRDTKAGMAGELAGDVATSLVPGGAIARLPKVGAAIKAGLKAKPAVTSTALGTAGGAAYGGAASGPEKRLEGATWGAAGGMLGGAAGKALDLGRTGLANIGQGARNIAERTGEFVPVHKSLKPGLWKTLYDNVFSELFGAGQMGKDAAKVRKNVTDRFIREAEPPTTGTAGYSPATKGTQREALAALDTKWKQAYGRFEGKPIDVGEVSTPVIHKILQNKDIQRVFDDVGDVVNSKTIMDIRTHLIQNLGKKATSPERDKMRKLIEAMDREWLRQLPRGEGALFKKLNEQYPKYSVLSKTGAQGGDISLSNLAANSRRAVSERSAAGGGGPMQGAAEEAAEVLGNKNPNPNIFRKAAAMSVVLGGGLGGIAGGPAGALTGALVATGIGKTMASRLVQRMLTGDAAAQRILTGIAENNPKVGALLRDMATRVPAVGAGTRAE